MFIAECNSRCKALSQQDKRTILYLWDSVQPNVRHSLFKCNRLATVKLFSFRVNTSAVNSVDENFDVSWILPCDNYTVIVH